MDHAIVGYSSVGDEDGEGSLGAPGMGEGKKANSRRATSMAILSGSEMASIHLPSVTFVLLQISFGCSCFEFVLQALWVS